MGTGPRDRPEHQDQWNDGGQKNPFGIVSGGDEIGPVEDGHEEGKRDYGHLWGRLGRDFNITGKIGVRNNTL